MKIVIVVVLALVAVASANVHYKLLKTETGVAFKVHNEAEEPVAMLGWNTPLDGGVRAPMFELVNLQSGEKVEYQGMLVKHTDPVLEHVSLVAVGGFVGTEFTTEELLGAYEVAQAGAYSLQMITPVHYLEIHQLVDLPAKRDLEASTAVSNALPIEFSEEQVELSQARAKQLAAGLMPLSGNGEINFNSNCDSSKQSVTSDSVARAICSITNVVPSQVSSSSSLYNTWFGTYSSSRASQVTSALTNAKSTFISSNFGVNCSPPQCGFGTFAYVYPNDASKVIHLCSAYWSASQYMTCCDTKPGTLIHEMCHFTVVGGTSDYAYGQSACKNLASTNPSRAVYNSDNFEYFNEHCSCGAIGQSCRNP